MGPITLVFAGITTLVVLHETRFRPHERKEVLSQSPTCNSAIETMSYNRSHIIS